MKITFTLASTPRQTAETFKNDLITECIRRRDNANAMQAGALTVKAGTKLSGEATAYEAFARFLNDLEIID